MKKVVSYSLWGDNKIYLSGVFKNYEKILSALKDYKMRVYVDSDCINKSKLTLLPDLEIVEINSTNFYHGMYWRFFAFEDCDVVLSRDLDSRITDREIELIRMWEQSTMNFFAIRDHPLHKMPIMGGIWGGRNGLKNITSLVNKYGKFANYGDDQVFLQNYIFPIIECQCLEFSSTGEFYFKNRMSFEKSKTGEFIGERIDEHELPLIKSDREF